MPLYKGEQNIGRNIKTEMAHGKPRNQAIAIAMSVAGKSRKKRKRNPGNYSTAAINYARGT